MTRRKKSALPIYIFAGVWLVCSLIFPMYKLWATVVTAAAAIAAGAVSGSIIEKRRRANEPEPEPTPEPEESYGPEIDGILREGKTAVAEMARLRGSIENSEVREKISQLMEITDKISRDAVDDPSDVPQIKKFMNYYLPTTIKLLNSYDRMSTQGIEGENLSRSKKSIEDMLDTAVAAYRKQLDSLFANQALDIETDIAVMNRLLAREGLSGTRDFNVEAPNGTN